MEKTLPFTLVDDKNCTTVFYRHPPIHSGPFYDTQALSICHQSILLNDIYILFSTI